MLNLKHYPTNEVPAEIKMALGRLFSIMSRPTQPGDVEMFHAIRAIVLDASEPQPDHRPNWARDRLKGAQGD